MKPPAPRPMPSKTSPPTVTKAAAAADAQHQASMIAGHQKQHAKQRATMAVHAAHHVTLPTNTK